MKTNTQMVLAQASRLLTRVEERGLFGRLDTAKRVIGKLERMKTRSNSEQAILGDARRQLPIIIDRIFKANIPLVVNIAQRLRQPGIDQEQFIAEGLFKLLNCIDAFDVSRGYRFSTYAYRSLYRKYNRYMKTTAARHKGQVEVDDVWMEQETQEPDRDGLMDLRHVLNFNLADLSETEIFLVKNKFGLGCPPRTLEALADLMGNTLTAGRLQQILAGALRKLRRTLEVTNETI